MSNQKGSTQEEVKRIRQAYIKVYGDKWKIQLVKHYWKVYENKSARSSAG